MIEAVLSLAAIGAGIYGIVTAPVLTAAIGGVLAGIYVLDSFLATARGSGPEQQLPRILAELEEMRGQMERMQDQLNQLRLGGRGL